MNIWDELGLEPTTDVRLIRRAYASRSKECHPEEQPEEFQRLHDAYEAALHYARSRPHLPFKAGHSIGPGAGDPDRASPPEEAPPDGWDVPTPPPVRSLESRRSEERENEPPPDGWDVPVTPPFPQRTEEPAVPLAQDEDLEQLVARGMAERRREQSVRYGLLLAKVHHLYMSEQAKKWKEPHLRKVWEQLLCTASFQEVKEEPGFLSVFTRYLLDHQSLADAAWLAIYDVYDLSKLEKNPESYPLLTEFFRAVAPHQHQALKELKRNEVRVKNRGNRTAVFSLICAFLLYLIIESGNLFALLPLAALILSVVVNRKLRVYERLLELKRVKRLWAAALSLTVVLLFVALLRLTAYVLPGGLWTILLYIFQFPIVAGLFFFGVGAGSLLRGILAKKRSKPVRG